MIILPQFSTFLEKTYKLEKDLHKSYRIYITEANEEGLEQWIKRVESEVLKPDTDKKSERDVFNQLTSELKCFLKTKEESKGIMILVGALLHRYFRLIISYEEKPWSLFTSMATDVFECRLFKSIRKALQLDEDANYSNYKKLDNKRLDSRSVLSCLEMFRDYMHLEDENAKVRWKKYLHFRDEPDFMGNLRKLIVKQKSLSKTPDPFLLQEPFLLNDTKAFDFIRSLAKQLQEECVSVATQLEDWGKLLIKDYPDFGSLDVETIEEHLCKNIQSENLRKKIQALYSIDLIQNQFKDLELHSPYSSEEEGKETSNKKGQDSFTNTILNPKVLIDTMKEAKLFQSSYILLGAYVLVMRTKNVSDRLKSMMREAVGPDDLSSNLKVNPLVGVRQLSDYLESNPDLALNCTYFNDRRALESIILKMLHSTTETKEKQVSACSI